MRIAGGTLRGRKIPVVDEQVRPTTERVREAIMSMLGPQWANRRILDGFAGSGAFGFEAISRGASHVHFVENNSRTAQQLVETANALGLQAQVVVQRNDTAQELVGLTEQEESFDVLFFDPPYETIDWTAFLGLCPPLMGTDGVVLIEHAPTEILPDSVEGLVLSDRRRYGSSAISVYQPMQRTEANA